MAIPSKSWIQSPDGHNYIDGITTDTRSTIASGSIIKSGSDGTLDIAVPNTDYQSPLSASDILTKVKTVDGVGSGLDADKLDGQEGSYYTNPINIVEPDYVRLGVSPTAMPLYDVLRGDRTAFLPASQIIIEKSTDAGVTWVDAEVTDEVKSKLFSGQRPSIYIPLLNGIRSCNCMIRITISAMRYNVPGGTAETEKYNYWNSTYIASTERYSLLSNAWMWVSGINDSIYCEVLASTGADPNTWFTKSTAYLGGWSGGNNVKIGTTTFGGGSTQTSNFWNVRFIFRTVANDHSFNDASLTTGSSNVYPQVIYHIKTIGQNVWTVPNNYMFNDHLYSWDYLQNVTFPAALKASKLGVTSLNTAPASSTDTGTIGDIRICSNYLYVCVNTNSWLKIPLIGWNDIQQLKAITDSEGYFTVDTVEGALAELAESKADLVDGVVPTSQLPSYVDDVVECSNFSSLPTTGEGGKIYVTLDDNKTYRWSGTVYVEISSSIALGETSSTAYRGDRGKTAYDHSQVTSGNPHGTTASGISITDSGSYFTTDTVEDALQQIGSELSGLATALEGLL